MSTRIATLGTCTSENWFHFQNIRERLDVNILRFQPSSVISVMADPVDMEIDPGTELDDREVQRLRTDFDKSYLSKLIEFKPDILIVELLADTRKGVVRVGKSWVTSSFRLEKSPMEARLGFPKPFTASHQRDAYSEVFRASTRKFGDFLMQDLPDCRIVLHRARWAEFFVDADNDLRSYPPWKQNEYFVANLRLDDLERIFCEEISCDEINVDQVPNFADMLHIWGPAADHYIKAYYHEFTRQLALLIRA